MGEIVTSNSNKDGFTHRPESFEYNLFNGSKCNTITSNYDGARGKRSNCNFYDETGFMAEKAFSATEPYTTQDADFKLGGDIDISLYPKQFKNQLIYASSASAVDTYFFKKYKEFSKQMFLGNKNYFVADIDCEVVLSPMFNGKLYPVALLTQEKIDNAMRENKEEALREYYNIFSKEGGDMNPFKRSEIMKNSEVRLPMHINEGNINRRIVFAYDPARSFDNSILGIAELKEDENIGLYMDIQNFISFADLALKKKTPMRYPDQRAKIKELLLDYNGKGFADYENIDCLMIDSGSGGAGVSGVADDFHEDWVDKRGITHRGLIDKIEHHDYIGRFPNAVDKIKLVSPKKYRTEMFDALVEMLNLGLIRFTETYEGGDYLSVPVVTGEGDEAEVEYVEKKLTVEDIIALMNIDIAKNQIAMIQKIYNSDNTGYKYALPADKSTEHDDHAYCLAMLAWRLKQLRRKDKLDRPMKSNTKIQEVAQFCKPVIKKRRI